MKRLLTSLAAVGLAVPLAVQPAAAWSGDFTTTLPPLVNGPTAFTVLTDAADICSMSFGGQTVNAAPWNFTFDPVRQVSLHSVDVRYCDGRTDRAYLDSYAAFNVIPGLASAEEGPVRVWVNNRTSEPATVTVRDGKGAVVKSVAIEGQDGQLSFRARGKGNVLGYTVDVQSASHRMTFPLDVMKGWNSYDRGFSTRADRPNLGTFPACSTVRWVYSDKGRPARTSESQILSDIRGAFARLSKETGLTFVRSKDRSTIGKDRVISIEWEKMGVYGPAGMGGPNVSYANGTSTYAGHVDLNSQDRWATDNGAAGFGQPGRWTAGRGWLLVHELVHALGMGHTQDATQLMAASNSGQHALGKGDLAGLHYLYPRKGC